MALLNPPDVTPDVTRLMVEAVIDEGGSATTEDIISYAAPGGIGGDESRTAGFSMRAATMLGLLIEDGKTVVVDPGVAQQADAEGSLRRRFGAVLRSKVADHETTTEAIELNLEGADERTTGVRDLAYGLTWLLAQDVFGRPLTWAAKDGCRSVENLQPEQLGTKRDVWPVMNDTRWPPLWRWALAMGLVTKAVAGPGAGEILPDPTMAVRDSVLLLQEAEPRAYTIGEFRRELGATMPYLDGGDLRSQLDGAVGGGLDADVVAGGVDSSLGMALISLQSERLLRIEDRADAESRSVIDPSGTPIGVSHVVLEGGKR